MHHKTQLKIILVGKYGVGKSTLAYSYAKGEYQENLEATVGTSFLCKNIKKEDEKVTLLIWDTAGAERYKSLMPMYSRDAMCAIICTDSPEYTSIIETINSLRITNQMIKIVVAITKLDLLYPNCNQDQNEEIVFSIMGPDWIVFKHSLDSSDIPYVLTSSIKKLGVDTIFEKASDLAYNLHKSKEMTAKHLETIITLEDKSSSKKGCC